MPSWRSGDLVITVHAANVPLRFAPEEYFPIELQLALEVSAGQVFGDNFLGLALLSTGDQEIVDDLIPEAGRSLEPQLWKAKILCCPVNPNQVLLKEKGKQITDLNCL